MPDWQPVIAALAIAIGLMAPAIAQAILIRANYRKIDATHAAVHRVEVSTNGAMDALRLEVADLRAQLKSNSMRVEKMRDKPR